MMPNAQAETAIHRTAQGFALAAGLIAVLGWITWERGQWHLLTFGADYVPMAPSTAMLFILLATGLFLAGRWPVACKAATKGRPTVGGLSFLR